ENLCAFCASCGSFFSNADGEALFPVDTYARKIELVLKRLFQRGCQWMLQFGELFVRVWRIQSIICDDQKFIESKTSAGYIFFKQPAGLCRRSENCGNVLRRRKGSRSFAIVQKTWTPIRQIDADVAFMCDQENSRPFVHVAVVVNVNQK